MRHYMKGVSIVNKKVLQTLEYYKIIDMLLEEADTPLAKESIRHLLPSSRREEIISWQTETSHALMRLLKQGRLPFHGLTDIRPSLVPLEKGGVLGMGELLDIARCLDPRPGPRPRPESLMTGPWPRQDRPNAGHHGSPFRRSMGRRS